MEYQLAQQEITQIKAAISLDDLYDAGLNYKNLEATQQRIYRLQKNLDSIQQLLLNSYISETEKDELSLETRKAIADAQIFLVSFYSDNTGNPREARLNFRKPIAPNSKKPAAI